MNPNDFLAPDLIRLAFVMGMILSVFLYEKSHLTTGSIVVPGFLGIHCFEPFVVAISVFNAWLCFVIVHQLIPRLWLIDNKTKFQALILTSVLLQLFCNGLSTLRSPVAHMGHCMAGLGFVIPGLIGHDMSRNGPAKTAITTFMATYLIGAMLLSLLWLTPQSSLNLNEHFSNRISFDLALLLVIGTSGAIFLKAKTQLQSGGYVTAAYVVFFGIEPSAIAILLLIALMTYTFSHCVLMSKMIIFGRRKFALMLISGALIMWAVLLFLQNTGIQIFMFNHPAYAGIIILLPGLIANDIQRTNIKRVVTGLGLLVGWVFSIASLYYEIKFFARPEFVCPLIVSTIAIWLIAAFLKLPTERHFSKQTIASNVA